MLDKPSVASALRELGLLLEVKGESPFKVRAYEAGARSLEESAEELAVLVERGRLRELPGIGEALEKKIVELFHTGHTPLLDRLRAELPPGLLQLLQVPDLGPRKVAALQAALGVASLAELEAACRAGRVRGVKGFGVKSEARILQGLQELARRGPPGRRVLLPDAIAWGERLSAHLAAGGADGLALAGEARRGEETVETVEVVAATREPAALLDRARGFAPAAGAELLAVTGTPAPSPDRARGFAPAKGAAAMPTGVELRPVSGPRLVVHAASPEEAAVRLLWATGPAGHLQRLGELARERGLVLGESGLAPAGGGCPLPLASEEALYAALGLAFLPPELRGDGDEVDAALRGELPDGLVRLEDVRGFVHCHTRWSDGRATVAEMASAAHALGATYLTITDHSPAAGYAGGLDRDRLLAQAEEMARVQETTPVRLLRGIEADILEDGALDLPDGVLEGLEVVVASVHQRHRQGKEEMTRRLVRAMRLPIFKIWGHALGRLLLEREPVACRVEDVLDALAASRGAVEVNGDPKRMELAPEQLRLATARGIPVVLSVDAHSTASLGYLRWAVTVARRGWVRQDEVLNALPADAFARAVRPIGHG